MLIEKLKSGLGGKRSAPPSPVPTPAKRDASGPVVARMMQQHSERMLSELHRQHDERIAADDAARVAEQQEHADDDAARVAERRRQDRIIRELDAEMERRGR